jgi:hypothetical protein
MALPVIANVLRCALEWTDSGATVGVRPVNVFHVHYVTGTASDAAGDVADALATSGSDMFDVLYTGLEVNSISVLPLDGTTATFDQPIGATIAGGGAGGIVPQVCTVVSLHTAQRGSRGRGRVYVGPMGETQIADGHVSSGSANTMLVAWGQFHDDLLASPSGAELAIASYVHADAHPVTSLRIDSVLGTQRRRQNQLRS